MKTLRSRQAGLLAGTMVLAGFGVLSPVAAQAADTCTFGFLGSTCTLGFLFDKVAGQTLNLTKLPTTGQGSIQFVEQSSGVYVVDVDFIPELKAVAAGSFEYELTIDPAPGNKTYFSEAGLDIIGPSLGFPIYSAFKDLTDTPVLSLAVDQDTRGDIGTFNDLLKKISVVDTYAVDNGSINSFQNSFTLKELIDPETVPGPLPLLGAGAAFGFSRRLRSRLLAAKRV